MKWFKSRLIFKRLYLTFAVCKESQERRVRDYWVLVRLGFDAFSGANKRGGKALCLTCVKKSPRFFPVVPGTKKLKIF
jgi:hypothetical protein